MERLRDRMAVDLRLRGMSPVTQRMYLGCVERFVGYHHRRSPKALGEAEIRSFLDHLVVERQLSRSTQRIHVAAIRFLYEVERPFTVRRTPFPQRDGERRARGGRAGSRAPQGVAADRHCPADEDAHAPGRAGRGHGLAIDGAAAPSVAVLRSVKALPVVWDARA